MGGVMDGRKAMYTQRNRWAQTRWSDTGDMAGNGQGEHEGLYLGVNTTPRQGG